MKKYRASKRNKLAVIIPVQVAWEEYTLNEFCSWLARPNHDFDAADHEALAKIIKYLSQLRSTGDAEYPFGDGPPNIKRKTPEADWKTVSARMMVEVLLDHSDLSSREVYNHVARDLGITGEALRMRIVRFNKKRSERNK